MSRRNGSRRGRPRKQQLIRVRTERRTPIDFAALARAVLEQAAMDDQSARLKHAKKPPAGDAASERAVTQEEDA